MTLFDPARHRPLSGIDWDEDVARAWIARVAAKTQRSFSVQDLWCAHPRDHEDDATRPPATDLYMGAAGVIWGLQDLVRRGHARAARDLSGVPEALLARNLQEIVRSQADV